MEFVDAIVVTTSCVVTIVSSTIFIGMRESDKPVFQPRGEAFAIWSVIFLLAISYALSLHFGVRPYPQRWRTYLYTSAFIVASIWAPFYAKKVR